jgi:DNA recombination protein RmuC
MFVPGENFYSAALERDSSLFEDAVALRVIIVTPATLIALAKAVAFGWRQEKVAENAQQVHALGQELYKRIRTMAEHVGNFGASLQGTVNHFNKFVGSMEHTVLPQARRFRDLEVQGTASEIGALVQIDTVARELRGADTKGSEAASAPKEASAAT